jgi:hypothetical protein
MSRASELADLMRTVEMRADEDGTLWARTGSHFLDASADELERLERVNAELVATWSIEAASRKMAEVMDYPWAHMTDQGRQQMRENAEQVIRAALTSATKEQQK